MDESAQAINAFLVEVFGEILRTEERCLAAGPSNDLSLTELHVIEAVAVCCREGRNSAAQVAQRLRVTAGTLTTAVNLLVRKGYLLRRQDERDRRVKRLELTERGRAADAWHAAFHAEMVREILRRLTPEEASALARGLEGAARFFREKYAAALPAKNSENKGEQSL